ncbi:MAG: PBP1A family penicillin-binding protein [Anaeromyxobacter sp.]
MNDTRKTPRARPRRLLRGRARRVVAVLAGLLALGLAAGGGGVWLATRELPAFDKLADYAPSVSTHVYGADGKEVFQFARERRTVVPLDELPEHLRKAVLAAEDAKFYQHEGLNYLAMGRCLLKGLLRGGVACGGSTITQQVVKTFLLSSDGRLKRKVKEFVLAPRLEENLSKDEILYLYLNQIYLGHLRYGMEEAARFYFGKSVRDVTLGEAATLAGVVQSPMRLSPVNHPARAKERQRYVLRRMFEEGWITKAQLDEENARPIVTHPPEPDPPGAWYADAIRKVLDEKYGAEVVETQGLEVDVAMDATQQRYAELALSAGLRAVDRRQGWRGPVVHLDEARVKAAMPLWRASLARVEPPPGEVWVWDLAKVNPEDIEPGEEAPKDVARMARARPLEVGDVYAGLVTEVEERSATVDLGAATGAIPLADVAWARKWNPSQATAAPKKMASVLAVGDVVQVRLMPAKAPPERLVREKKPLPLSLEQTPLVQGALVALDPATRGVRALVGGYDFATSQFNRALQARRQPGSAMKPFVWGAAIESRRFTPATVVYDTPDVYRDPWTGKEWKPRNFEKDQFDGPMLLTAALAHSKNTVSVKLTDALGVDAVIGFAQRMGIASELPKNLTLALGTGEVQPLELVNAYAGLADGGRYVPPVMILRVRDRHGNVLLQETPSAPVPAAVAAPSPVPAAGEPPPAGAPPDGAAPPADPAAPPEFTLPAIGTRPDVAYVVTDMMRGVVEYGTGAAAKSLARPIAGKTGTAQEHRDAWFVGFTPELVAGVWIGFDDHAPLGPRETGAVAALPAWMSFVQATLGGRPPSPFTPPPGVDVARIDPASGMLAPDGAAAAPTLTFLTGTAPTETAAANRQSAPQNFFMEDR